jgi:hypothetical protein
MRCRQTSRSRAWPWAKQEVLTARGTDWTALAGSSCDPTVAACVGEDERPQLSAPKAARREPAARRAVLVRGRGDTVPRCVAVPWPYRLSRGREAQTRRRQDGPLDACPGACFWHCTPPDGTRKATPSQPSRGPWIRMARAFLAISLQGHRSGLAPFSRWLHPAY